MKASAMSGKNSVPSIIGLGTRLRQNGPIKIPATIYAVTFGRRSRFVSLVIKKPERRIIEIEMMAAETEESELPPS
jgi:hypothetical protein